MNSEANEVDKAVDATGATEADKADTAKEAVDESEVYKAIVANEAPNVDRANSVTKDAANKANVAIDQLSQQG